NLGQQILSSLIASEFTTGGQLATSADPSPPVLAPIGPQATNAGQSVTIDLVKGFFGGSTSVPVGLFSDNAYAVAVYPSGPNKGKMLIGGAADLSATNAAGCDVFALVRLNADGSLDTTFD